MSTLLLRLAAPLQSWGSSSRFNRRTTEREPTKSGVLGLVAAALGRRRSDPIEDLLCLRFGVRIDQPGRLVSDFHTAHTADGVHSFVSHRHYLADALFLVGLEGEEKTLERIDNAVRNPVFPLYLGRRSCPPEGRVSLGIRQGLSLDEALKSEEWLAHPWYRQKAEKLFVAEIVSDASDGETGAYQARDYPIDFSQNYRRYAFRSIYRQQKGVCFSNESSRRRASSSLQDYTGKKTQHDPLGEVRECDRGEEGQQCISHE